jgi:glycosyltransferase involved in cell wall biosynthesis
VAFAIGTARIGSKWKYARARHYVAVSEFVKKVLIEGGVPAAMISVVYDGVPAMEREAAAGDIIALRKGAALATEAAAIAKVPIVITDDLEHDLRRASTLVYITHAEGLGSGALMAMAAGVPVIASNLGGLPEIVRHRETGLLVDNDPVSIAAAIRELLSDRDLARSLAAEGRRVALERFTVEQMVRRTIEVYRQVLA